MGKGNGRRMRAVFAMVLTMSLSACDREGRPIQHIGMDRLQPQVSVEADVVKVFGPPDRIVTQPDGTRVLQFPMGPEGPRTFFATIGTDGKMIAVVNVLTPPVFSRVRRGMSKDEVRDVLGRPGRETPWPRQQQTGWSWLYVDGPHVRLYVVTFDEAGRVVSFGTEPDPRESLR